MRLHNPHDYGPETADELDALFNRYSAATVHADRQPTGTDIERRAWEEADELYRVYVAARLAAREQLLASLEAQNMDVLADEEHAEYLAQVEDFRRQV